MARPIHKPRTAKDFTEGGITRHLVEFSIPLFLGNLLQALYNTVDSIWVGRFLGPEALAAVSLSFPIVFTLVSMAVGLTMATTVLVAQYFGARKDDMVKETIETSLAFLSLLGVCVSILGMVFHRPILKLLNTPPEIMDMAANYLAIYSAGLVFTFAYNVLGGIYRGLGDSRTPLLFLTYATVMNIILDPIMIFGVFPFPRMNVAGAALATVVSQAFSVLMGIRHLAGLGVSVWGGPRSRSGTTRPRINLSIAKLTVKIGLPAGIQQALVALSGMAVVRIVNSFGTAVVAAYGAGVRLDQFALMPSMSVSMAVSTLVGQNLGAGRMDRVRATVNKAGVLAAGIAALISLVALTWPRVLLTLFTTSAEVMAVGTRYLRIVGISYIPFALMFVTNGALRGAGDTVPSMANTLGSLWLVRVPLARYLSAKPSLGSDGVWIAIATSQFVGMLLARAYYATGRWKTKAIARREGDVPGSEF